MQLYLVLVILLAVAILANSESVTEVLRPRGVPLSKKAFYDPSRDFTCLDGSNSIPFLLVNDDYCDCADASDEPGTSACPNGIFHCSNIGYIEKIIPSSRVNDGICDCCDASDEYNSSAQCINNCMELGAQLREEQRRREELLKAGKQIRDQYVEQAKKKKEESATQLETLKKELQDVENEKNAKEAIKRDAEDKEKAAIDKFKSEEDEVKRKREEEEMQATQERERQLALIAFNNMDLNHDNKLHYTEVQAFAQFDKNGDGTVSEEEAKFFLHAANEMEFEEFTTTGWVIMKPYYTKSEQLETNEQTNVDPSESVTPLQDNNKNENEEEVLPNEHEVEGLDTEDDNLEPGDDSTPNDEEEDDEEPEEPPFLPPRDAELLSTPTSILDSEYDEETKQLIEIAKQAKQEYSNAEGKFLDIQNRIRELEVLLESDFGQDAEFMPLHSQCFEYTDREYTYKLCPFDRASQRSKDGGSETSLGRWGKWFGPEEDKYSRMKYEGGATCWNGPARSVVVNVVCGTVNEITSASEPSRCEYEFDFSTPALCNLSQLDSHDHDEL